MKLYPLIVKLLVRSLIAASLSSCADAPQRPSNLASTTESSPASRPDGSLTILSDEPITDEFLLSCQASEASEIQPNIEIQCRFGYRNEPELAIDPKYKLSTKLLGADSNLVNVDIKESKNQKSRWDFQATVDLIEGQGDWQTLNRQRSKLAVQLSVATSTQATLLINTFESTISDQPEP